MMGIHYTLTCQIRSPTTLCSYSNKIFRIDALYAQPRVCVQDIPVQPDFSEVLLRCASSLRFCIAGGGSKLTRSFFSPRRARVVVGKLISVSQGMKFFGLTIRVWLSLHCNHNVWYIFRHSGIESLVISCVQCRTSMRVRGHLKTSKVVG